MDNKLESLESKVSETRSVIQEFGEKISQALELEKKKLKEQAEEEAKQIVARANEEASKFIIQARQESEIEANKFLEKIKEKATQIIKESREKAADEARRESARMVNETREKAAQIITGVIESSLRQVKSEFSQTVSEVKNKLENESSRLLTVTRNIEQIINETQSNIQTSIDHLVKTINETGNKLHSLNEIPDEESNVSEQQPIEETEETEETERTATPENHNITANLPQASEAKKAVPAEKPAEPATAIDQMHITAASGIETGKLIENPAIQQPPREEVYSGTEETENQVDRDEIEKQLQKGIELLDESKKEEALEILAKVIEKDPDNALAWRKLGTALGMLGKYDEALKALRRATDLAPKDITAWHNTKIILDKLGQKKEAREAKDMEKQLIKEYPEQYKDVFKKK